MQPLPATFFARPTLIVARELLGKAIMVNGIGGIITETEAYLPNDAASHSCNGQTPRNAAMFAKPGSVYVYKSYGMHHCVNLVTEAKGIGAAVLLRAITPLPKSLKQIQQIRGVKVLPKNLCNGPGKLCQALGINIDHNLQPLGVSLQVYDTSRQPQQIIEKPRVGISKNTDVLWNFSAKAFE
jgi:DNA-3-methyladenine glycosylase